MLHCSHLNNIHQLPVKHKKSKSLDHDKALHLVEPDLGPDRLKFNILIQRNHPKWDTTTFSPLLTGDPQTATKKNKTKTYKTYIKTLFFFVWGSFSS